MRTLFEESESLFVAVWLSISGIEVREALARSVTVSDEALSGDLADGRTIAVPLAWFPRLLHGTPARRANWRLIGGGAGIHWPDLDEDISAEGLLAGRRSGETQESLARWRLARNAGNRGSESRWSRFLEKSRSRWVRMRVTE